VRAGQLSNSDAPVYAQEVRRGTEKWSNSVLDMVCEEHTITSERPAVAVMAAIWEIPGEHAKPLNQ
jgi:hypothetical protein